jgi:hypothetical protein
VCVRDRAVALVDTVPDGDWTTTFTLHPSVSPSPLVASETRVALSRQGDEGLLELRMSAPGASLEIVDAEYSPSYGVRQACQAVRVRWTGGVMTTELAPAMDATLAASSMTAEVQT